MSSCVEENDAFFNPVPETRVVAKFNVTSTSSPTTIGYNKYISGFSAIEIDGVEQPSVVSAYTFSTTGKHTVKYTLADPTAIGGYAFRECKSLTSIDIPNSVTTIGYFAFAYCSGLTSCTIGSGVTSIGDSAFRYCSSLTSINIPNSITTIGDSAFYNCSGLTSIEIPSGVTSIGMDSFYHCGNVSHVYCRPNPTNLTWSEDGDDFKSSKATKCHVYSQYLSAYQSKFGKVNVTFQGDLT